MLILKKFKYSGYGIGFDTLGSFSLSDGGEFGKNVMIFSADMSSSRHADNIKGSNASVGRYYID